MDIDDIIKTKQDARVNLIARRMVDLKDAIQDHFKLDKEQSEELFKIIENVFCKTAKDLELFK